LVCQFVTAIHFSSTLPIVLKSEAMIKFKDVAHLYLMCEVIANYDGEPRKGLLTGVRNGGYEAEIQFYEEDGFNVMEEPTFNEIAEVKPILRPLSDMTEDEEGSLTNKCFGEIGFYVDMGKIILSPWPTDHRCGFPVYVTAINWLRKNGFDCDGLIESGEAINKTKHK
jgi:hypothetical protein